MLLGFRMGLPTKQYTNKSIYMEWKQGEFVVSDDQRLFDVAAVHSFLTESYWAKGRSLQTVEKSISNSFCLGLFNNGKQVGFCRAITDYCTFAYLCDVYVLESYRKKGLGHFLMKSLFAHPKVHGVKWLLKTTYSQSLYADFNFQNIESAFGWMVRDREP